MMVPVLEFIFSSFWTFIGSCTLMLGVCFITDCLPSLVRITIIHNHMKANGEET